LRIRDAAEECRLARGAASVADVCAFAVEVKIYSDTFCGILAGPVHRYGGCGPDPSGAATRAPPAYLLGAP